MTGKLKGLTRPGSKIELSNPAQAGAPVAPTDITGTSKDGASGQALVGLPVRKLFGRSGWFDGTITHYVAATDIYRVR